MLTPGASALQKARVDAEDGIKGHRQSLPTEVEVAVGGVTTCLHP